jgi:para-nitrobenzyl esterase
LKAAWFVVFLYASGAAYAGNSPTVIANGEELSGSWVAEHPHIATFKGIPFAQPPIGDLRWRAPQIHQPRIGPQTALEFAPGCMQTAHTTDWYASVAAAFGYGPEVAAQPNGVNEDCLYLNIWTPQTDTSANLPVMIWVHGGSNKGGWSYEPNYMGESLAAKGVVVVSIAYRMGAFGFFSHPLLDNGNGEPVANFGLLDVAAGFDWVKAHISGFGGNPDNITLIGESAGAGDISDLLSIQSPHEEKYSRAILQSSASGLTQRRTLADEQKLGQQLIKNIGIQNIESAEQLRKIPAQDLLAASMAIPDHYFDAVIDGLTMKMSPVESFRKMSRTNVDILIGTNADEWYMYIDENVGRSDLENVARQRSPDHADKLLMEVADYDNVRRSIDHLQTAGDTLCPSRYLAGRVSESGGRAWVYYFTRQRPGPGGEQLGAYHGTEIPYVFNTHDDWLPTEETDHALSDTVMDYWVEFARAGDPNLPEHPRWPLYQIESPMVMELGETIGPVKPHDQGLCEILGVEP